MYDDVGPDRTPERSLVEKVIKDRTPERSPVEKCMYDDLKENPLSTPIEDSGLDN
ncbi:hypothetical protein [Trichocoleus sp. DQ-U1]|uniref:hypothetical protein n=1 Tax=Trichocoleus sp. DQ-U1 TaxID=2933926 RepID=UPI00329A3224